MNTELTVSEINENNISASNVIAALSKFDDSTYDAIIESITNIRKQRDEEELREYSILQEKLKAKGLLPADSDNSRNYSQFVNPNNSAEVYKTGKYPDWLKQLAAKNGINTNDKSAMATWMKSKKSH